MSVNPYEPPRTETHVVGVLSGNREDLISVARYQKGILVCILIYLTAGFVQFALPPGLVLILGLMVAFVAITGTIFVFLLAIKVYKMPIGILLGILALIPLIGLLVLLMVNGKATRILRQNGIRVGLMGANLSEI